MVLMGYLGSAPWPPALAAVPASGRLPPAVKAGSSGRSAEASAVAESSSPVISRAVSLCRAAGRSGVTHDTLNVGGGHLRAVRVPLCQLAQVAVVPQRLVQRRHPCSASADASCMLESILRNLPDWVLLNVAFWFLLSADKAPRTV